MITFARIKQMASACCKYVTGVNMASQEECNKPQCKANVNNDQESNFIIVYKKLEQVLNNKNELFTKKVESLIEVWKQVCTYSLSDKIPYVVQLMDWAKFHTLNIVLNGDWKKYKDVYEQKLLHEVECTEKVLLKLNNVFSMRCKKLAEVIRDPWGNPILYRLLNTPDAPIGPEEIEFFCIETGYLVSHRLKKLCESQCEDLALNLVTAFMRCYRMAETQQFNLNATEEQKWFIFDVYIALLFKYKKMSLILSTLKTLSLKEGFELVKRFTHKRVKISKVWRHSTKIAQLACQVYVTATVMKPPEEGSEILGELLKVWFAQNEGDECLESLTAAIRRIIQAAESAVLMYVFCEAVFEKFGTKMKTFTIELYIRALTTDMNDLERQKNEQEHEKVSETTKRLAQGFCRLADILEEHINVSRECVLTSFSLQPTPERLKRIEDLARLCGYEVLDTGQAWKCKLHPPALPSDELCWTCSLCGEYMSQPQIEAAINTNTALCEALTAGQLGLSPQLCDDLAVLLSSPRYQILSWLLQWRDLHRLCVMYLHAPERTKNLVTELKFVDIDYSVFMTIKREPEDEEVTGIERGYEHFLETEFYSDEELTPLSEDSASQESHPYSLGSDGAGESPSCFLPVAKKSDPDVLKSLRMFRPNLKRARPLNIEEKVPEKVFICSSNTNQTVSPIVPIPTSPTKSLNPQNEVVAQGPYSYSLYGKNILNNTYTNSLNNMYLNNLNGVNYERNFIKTYSKNDDKTKNHQNFNTTAPNNLLHKVANTYSKVCKNGLYQQKQIKTEISNNLKQNCEVITIDSDDSKDAAISISKNEKVATLPPITTPGEQVAKVKNNGSILSTLLQEPTEKLLRNKCYNNSPERMVVSFDDFEKFSGQMMNSDKIIVPVPITPEKRKLHRQEENIPPVNDAKNEYKKKCVDEKITFKDAENSLDVQIKDVKVMLNRVNIKNYINRKVKRKNEEEEKRKQAADLNVVQYPPAVNKAPLKPYPLQDKNPRVVLTRNDIVSVPELNKYKSTKVATSKPTNSDMSDYPKVFLKRLDLEKRPDAKSVLANVPGLNDLQLIRPSVVDQIVQVVQIAGGRPASNVAPQNTQTSTQVSPHIQRVGQPRNDKPEQTSEAPTTTSVATSTTASAAKPVASQPSTLINILSQQIIRPSQSNCIRNRTSPLINILSQQIIRPATTALPATKSTTSTNTAEGTNVSRIVSSSEPQVTTAVRNAPSTIKTVVNSPTSDQSRIVQFICKSTDGKLIPVTSFTSNRVVKVATTQTVTSTSPTSPTYEENFTKLVKVGTPKPKNDENPDTLPKFQQAFGKTVYQNSVDGNSNSSVSSESTAVNNVEADKKIPKTTSVNIQSIQGGVIYTRQMPVGQAINLIPPGRGQVFRIATSNSEHTVIHSKMSALLAAALQGKQKSSESSETDNSSSEDTSNQMGTKVTVTRPTLVQNARIVKPVLQIPSNVSRNNPQPANLSSTTLEQLREFDMVYKQVKERSSTNTTTEPTTTPETVESSQRISVTYLNNQGQKFTQLSPVVVVSSYCSVQPAASPALSVTSQGSSSPCVTPAPTPTLPKVSSSKNSKGKSVKNTTTHTSKASPIPKPQQKPQEDEHTTQRIFDILAEYAEQLRNSPDLNNKPAPRRRSNPPTNPNQNSKRKKSSGAKKTGQCSSTVSSEADIEDPRTIGSEDSSCGVVQISVQDEEQPQTPVQTESNDSAPVGTCQQLILTDSTHNQTRNLIIADSTVGEALKIPNTAVLVPGNYIMPVSMVKGGQQIAVVSGGSKILATVPARSGPNMLLFQSFLNQTRKAGIPTVKYSTIQPISGISSQSLAGVSAHPPVVLPPASHGISAVTLGQPIALKKLSETDRVNTELLLTISQPQFSNPVAETVQQAENSGDNVEIEQSTVQSDSSEKIYTFQKSLIAAPIATPVISQAVCTKDDEQHTAAQTIMSLSSQDCNKGDLGKVERVQSVLVTTCTSNGPMLSHSPPSYSKTELARAVTDAPKEEYLRTAVKTNTGDQKHFQTGTVYFQKTKKAHLDRELHQLSLQRKQAALERELRLQKSLSEECEDLGVDEPSTSDLFPEADLLFESNNSPSFDHSSQDVKRNLHLPETKEEGKPVMTTLFSDDDNSGSLRTDFLFESVEYQTAETELEYASSRQLTNGQSSTSNESGSSCEDNALLQNCTSMSDVTLNSPMSPDQYAENTPPALNKYKYKYTNRKKNDRHKQTEAWPAEVSSSEDTTGSTELAKSSSRSPELCSNKRSHSLSCDEELSDGGYKVVRVAISKSDFLKEDESCEELHCEEDVDSSVSGRGARRSVKKLCSCCNGSQDAAASRKRPTSRPHTPAPHKKAFLTKKR